MLVDFYAGGNVSAACSGALIAPNVVLTAAHCAEGSTSARVTAPFAKGQTTSVADIRTYDWVLGATDHHATHDLALLILRDPMDVAAYATIDKAPCPGCKVDHVGRLGDGLVESQTMRTSKTSPVGRPYDWFLPHASDDAGGEVVLAGTKTLVGLEVGRGQQSGGGYVVRLDEVKVRQWISFNLNAKDLPKYRKGRHGKLIGPVFSGQHLPGPPPDDSSASADAATADAATTDAATTDAATTDTATTDTATTDTSTTDGSTGSGAGGDTSATTGDTGAGGDTSTTSGDTGAGGAPDETTSGAGGGGDEMSADPPPEGEGVDPGGTPDPGMTPPGDMPPEPYDPSKIDILNPDGDNLDQHHSPGYWGTSSTDPEQKPVDDQLVETEKANAEQAQSEAYVIGTHGYPGQMESYPDAQAQMEMQEAAAEGKQVVMSVCFGGLATESNDSSASVMAGDLGIPKDQVVGCTGNVTPNDGSFDCDGTWVDGNGDPPKSTDLNGIQLRNCANDINGQLQCP